MCVHECICVLFYRIQPRRFDGLTTLPPTADELAHLTHVQRAFAFIRYANNTGCWCCGRRVGNGRARTECDNNRMPSTHRRSTGTRCTTDTRKNTHTRKTLNAQSRVKPHRRRRRRQRRRRRPSVQTQLLYHARDEHALNLRCAHRVRWIILCTSHRHIDPQSQSQRRQSREVSATRAASNARQLEGEGWRCSGLECGRWCRLASEKTKRNPNYVNAVSVCVCAPPSLNACMHTRFG